MSFSLVYFHFVCCRKEDFKRVLFTSGMSLQNRRRSIPKKLFHLSGEDKWPWLCKKWPSSKLLLMLYLVTVPICNRQVHLIFNDPGPQQTSDILQTHVLFTFIFYFSGIAQYRPDLWQNFTVSGLGIRWAHQNVHNKGTWRTKARSECHKLRTDPIFCSLDSHYRLANYRKLWWFDSMWLRTRTRCIITTCTRTSTAATDVAWLVNLENSRWKTCTFCQCRRRAWCHLHWCLSMDQVCAQQKIQLFRSVVSVRKWTGTSLIVLLFQSCLECQITRFYRCRIENWKTKFTTGDYRAPEESLASTERSTVPETTSASAASSATTAAKRSQDNREERTTCWCAEI